MNPASNTTTPVALLTRIRVCSLHLIGHACFERSRPTPVDELRSITIKVGGTGGRERVEEGSTSGRHELRPRGSVQGPRGICGTKAYDIESMCFTALDLTHGICCGDSILAAAQILTPGFSRGCRLGWNPELPSWDNQAAWNRAIPRKVKTIMPATCGRACFALWSNSEGSTATLGFQAATIALRKDRSLQCRRVFGDCC